MRNKTLKAGFIGFGLIGGSIARCLRHIYPDSTILAYNYHTPAPSAPLEAAKADGVLDDIKNSLSDGFPDCDIIFLCAPVLRNIEYIKTLQPMLHPDCILTDVGSVKGNIHSAIAELGLDAQFIGGHPMAGSEKTGYENSSLTLLENAYYILTPTESTKEADLSFMKELVAAIGAIPVVLDAKSHDTITAAISHVPHIISASLVNLVGNAPQKEQMAALAAGGFKDITRISSSSPQMWQNICLTNTDCMISCLQDYIQLLTNAERLLKEKDADALYQLFADAKAFRDSIPNSSTGLLCRNFTILVDIRDEMGAFARVATLLAENHINIKNMGILNNREFIEGVLGIELANQKDVDTSIQILKEQGYVIFSS